MNINPLLCIDFYKADHRRQYPEGTTMVYSNFTARSTRLAPLFRENYDDKIVYMNPVAEIMSGYSLKEVMGKSSGDNKSFNRG